MKKNCKLLPIEISLIIGMILSIISSYFGVVANSEDISNRILRFHIIANSDSEVDQNLKLKVRDEILKSFNFSDAYNLNVAKEDVINEIPEIEKVASSVVEKEGFSYNVKASVVNMFFSTRHYDNFTIPSGMYDALRITIGEAKGHNWWCVLYPPLCVEAAKPQQELDKTLDENQNELVNSNEEYDVRFAAIELFERLKNFFSQDK